MLSPTQSGGGAIRTLDALRHAAFPRRWNKPLSDASSKESIADIPRLTILCASIAIYRTMTHVSKRKIEPATERKIVDAFMHAIFSTNLARGKARVRALLTPTERIMLAKRLAVITMLEHDHSYYRIGETLNVSISTIRRLHRRLLAGHFDPLCRVFNRNLSFLDYAEIFLSAGMPSIAGPRHQRRLDALRAGRKPR